MDKYKLKDLIGLCERATEVRQVELHSETGTGAIRIEVEDDTSMDYEDFKDNIGFFLCGHHRRYDFNTSNIEPCGSLEDLVEEINTCYDVFAILPFYMYEHGGIALNTTGFSCPWDSGQLGYVFMTDYQAEDLAITSKEEAEEYMSKSIRTLSRFNEESLYQINFGNIVDGEFEYDYGVGAVFEEDIKEALMSSLSEEQIIREEEANE